jgi:hypothetical protein
LAPPFTGLDTLPALAVVIVGLVIGVAGIALEIFLGKAAVDAVGGLF